MPITKLYKIINRSEYSKNILSVFSANAFAQFLPIITAPILTRIYSPDDYGYLGILMSIVGITSVFVTLSYSNAILIAESEEEAQKVVSLCLKITFIVTVISLIGVLLFSTLLNKAYHIEENQFILLFVPLGIFFTGYSTIYSLLTTRYKFFKMLSLIRIVSAILSSMFSIVLGLIMRNVLGLVIGFLVGQFILSVVLYILLNKKHPLPSLNFNLRANTKEVFKKFINFPKYVLTSDFINNFSNQIPIFALSAYAIAPQAAIGFYNMSNRILGIPITLISGSIGDVFKQRAAEDYNKYGTCRPIFMKTFKTLLAASILPFALLIIFGGDLFAFAFGEKWREAGQYSQILGFMFMFRFVISPLTYVFYIAQKQRLDFWLHILFILFGFLALYIGNVVFNSVIISLWFFTGFYSLLYILYFFLSYKFSIKPI